MNSFWPSWKEDKLFTGAVIIVMALISIFLASAARNSFKENYYIGKNPDLTRTITISGQGKVVAVPDIAIINLGYSVEKKTVSEAQKDNTQKINELIKRVKEFGVAPADITTTAYNVYPQYDYTDGRSILRGYSVNQNVEIKVRDSAQISSVVSLIGELELNQVGGIQFKIDDPEVYNQLARIKALENAKEKADELAKVMKVKLGKVVSFTESSQGFPEPIFYSKAEAFGVGGGGAAPSIEQGSQEVIIIASVTYELE